MAVKRLSPLRLTFILIASLAAWVSAGALSIASAQPGAARVGILPPGPWLAASIAIAVLLGVMVRGTWVSLLSISILLLLPWLPVPVPAAFFIWVGHLRAWVWALIAFAVAMSWVRAHAPRALSACVREPRRAAQIAAAIAALSYLAGAYQVFPQLPAGDEPHYLVISESLLRDHDLKVENNYRRADYHAYFRDNLRPDYLRRGQNGEIYSIHAPGLPALVAPVFAVFGYPGVLALLAIMSGCATGLAWTAAWRVTKDVGAAWFGWSAVALSVPFFFQSFVAYPESLGAAIVILGVLTLIDDRPAVRRLVWTGVGLALLPWLHLRLAIPAVVLGGLIAGRELRMERWPPRVAALLAVPVVSAVCWFAFFYVIYGTFDPRAPYGGSQQSALANLPRGLIGLAFDQQFGALPNAPVYLCAALGFFPLYRARPRLATELLVVALPYTLSVAAFAMWWGGTSSAARFLTPLLLTLAIPIAAWYRASRGRASRMFGLGALGVSVLITATIAIVDRGGLLYNTRDGMSRLLLWLSPVVDLTTGVPSLFQNEPRAVLAHAAVWLAAVAAAGLIGRAIASRTSNRATRAAGIALATAGCSMVAVSIVWRSNRARPLTPATGNITLLRAFDGRSSAIAIQYAPLARLPLGNLPPLLVIGAFPLPGAPSTMPADVPLVRVQHTPAAAYVVDVALRRSGDGVLTVSLDGRFGPTWRWDLDGAAGLLSREFLMPVPAAEIVVDADAAGRAAIERVTLRAVDPLSPARRASDREPWHAVRYGSALAFLMDGGRAYAEAGGVWVGGEAFLDLVVMPDDSAKPVQLFVRNPPVENQITIDAGAWRQSLTFKPGEERTFEIPVPAGRVALPVRVSSAHGARPSEFERGSGDTRLLGCWIEIR